MSIEKNTSAELKPGSSYLFDMSPFGQSKSLVPGQNRAANKEAQLALAAAARLLILLAMVAIGLGGCAFSSPSSSATGRFAAKTAHKYIGVPYKLGGKSPKEGFDCSGLVQYVYARHGVKLPRSAIKQSKKGRKVRKSQLQPGDLVFFSTGRWGRVSHVGIYIGNDKFIHAPGRGKKTTQAKLSSGYFKKTFHSARRID